MRDINRIHPLMENIEAIWKKHPDMRLGQLLSCVVPDGRDIFYVEDDELLQLLADFEERLQKERED